jgi:hypothetical protein
MPLDIVKWLIKKGRRFISTPSKNSELQRDSDPRRSFLAMREMFDSDAGCPEILFYGDSVVERISRYDRDRRTLDQMVASLLEPQARLGCVSNSAYHMGVFYQLTRVLEVTKRKPRVLILPINMRSFSPQWDLNPLFQCEDHIETIKNELNRLQGIDAADVIEDDPVDRMKKYLETDVAYPGTAFTRIRDFVNRIDSIPFWEKDRVARLKQLFIFHYMYPLNDSHPKLRLLRDTLTLIRGLGVDVVSYITPVNYQTAITYVGEPFLPAFNSNLRLIHRLTGSNGPASTGDSPMIPIDGGVFRDCSTWLDSSYFFNKDNATEHLNEKGRGKLAERIAEMCLETSRQRVR